MTERERIIERLRAVDLGGGSHESLSAIAKAIYEPVGGWTIGACEQLRQTLVRLLGEADTAPSGGRITAELRKYALGWDERNRVRRELTAIADRIDAEHERVRAESIIDMTDESMAEHGWIRLPKDADGEVWHIGDEIQAPDNCHETVEGFRVYELDGEQRWEVIANGYLWGALTHRHYCQPTVEDVLYDSLKHFGAVEERTPEVDSWVCEQAVKLRKMLAGDAE